MPSNSVTLVTSQNARELSTEDDALLDALTVLGVPTKIVSWDDESYGWESSPLTILRTTWDYHRRLPEFQAWLDRVKDQTTLLNTPDLVRWNWDKRYLLELQSCGVPIVETLLIDSVEDVEKISSLKHSSLVIKPTIAAGAYDTLVHQVNVGDSSHQSWQAPREHAERILKTSSVLVQPYIDAITKEGETSIVLFEGEIHHAVTKKPKQGDFRVQFEFGGQYTVVEPKPVYSEIALQCISALPEVPFYARVDIVEGPDGPCLMEMELIEPELFLLWVPQAALVFADAIRERLSEVTSV